MCCKHSQRCSMCCLWACDGIWQKAGERKCGISCEMFNARISFFVTSRIVTGFGSSSKFRMFCSKQDNPGITSHKGLGSCGATLSSADTNAWLSGTHWVQCPLVVCNPVIKLCSFCKRLQHTLKFKALESNCI